MRATGTRTKGPKGELVKTQICPNKLHNFEQITLPPRTCFHTCKGSEDLSSVNVCSSFLGLSHRQEVRRAACHEAYFLILANIK